MYVQIPCKDYEAARLLEIAFREHTKDLFIVLIAATNGNYYVRVGGE